MKHYPTAWQRKTMWTALTALCVVLLFSVVAGAVWIGASVIAFLQPILIPVAIAIILSYLLDPIVTKLQQRGWNRTVAILTLFAIAFLALAALLVWLVPVISMQSANFAKELPSYTEKARDQIVDVLYRYDKQFGVISGTRGKSSATSSVINWLLGSPTPKPRPTATAVPAPAPAPVAPTPQPSPPTESISAAQPKITNAERQRIQEWVQRQMPNIESQLPYLTSKLWLLIKNSVGGFLGAAGFLLSLVMVPIYLFFLLKQRPAISQRWRDYLPLRNSPFKDELAAVLSQINNYVIAYFRGQLLVCLVDGILIGTSLTLFGLNFAPLIGCFVVVLTMIPYIGIILCWIPTVIIAIAQWGDWMHPLAVTGIFFVIQNLEGLFYAPRIVGNSVGLHPMTVIVSIFVWGLLIGGLLGPLLAVPLTATLKVLLTRYVWDPRVRERAEHKIADVPIVREAEHT